MGKAIIYVNSITYANKGRSVLNREGIPSYIERNRDVQGLHGCGYGLKVAQRNLQRALEVLKENEVRILIVENSSEFQ